MANIDKIKKGDTTYNIQDANNEGRFSSGILKVANGGTGASSEEDARTSLSVYSKAETDALVNAVRALMTPTDVTSYFTFAVPEYHQTHITSLTVKNIVKMGNVIQGRLEVTLSGVSSPNSYYIEFDSSDPSLMPVMSGPTVFSGLITGSAKLSTATYHDTEYWYMSIMIGSETGVSGNGSIDFMYICNG